MSAAADRLRRCDRCGATARVQVVFPSGGELLMCGHHFELHRPKLADVLVLPTAACTARVI